jgi:hypothetical protein
MFFLCIPVLSEAAVTISEIAWMGSATSANHEWIELYNSGPATDVTGWTLTDGMNLNISLTGTIPAGSYAVLERTSDDSAPGSMFMKYGGALVNTGATLTLKRTDGSIEDQVAGGENWLGVCGDNVTKETSQYTTSGWVTGTPTPGSANSGISCSEVVEEPDDEEEEETEEVEEEIEEPITELLSRSRNSSETVRLILTDSMLALKIDAQKVGYVNQPIYFEAIPTGVGITIENSLAYTWNFGDGGVTYGSEPTHSFAYPGTYIVTVYGAYKRQEQLARHQIKILPVTLSVTKNMFGDVQINNDSPYEIDVSEYLVQGERSFQFPEYSIILPKQTVTLAEKKIGSGLVRVLDAKGKVVTYSGAVKDSIESFTAPDLTETFSVAKTTSADSVPFVLAPSVLESRFGFAKTAEASTETKSPILIAPASSTIPLATTSSKTNIPANAWPYLGLIVLILIGLFGTATKFGRNQNE